jgi:hypothetical protein
VVALAFTADARQLLAIGSNRVAQLWQAAAQEEANRN